MTNSIIDIVRQVCRSHPDRIAIRSSNGNITFAEFLRRINGLASTLRFGATFTLSQTGVLIYKAGSSEGSQLTWFDRTGNRLGVLASGDYNDFVALSPDSW